MLRRRSAAAAQNRGTVREGEPRGNTRRQTASVQSREGRAGGGLPGAHVTAAGSERGEEREPGVVHKSYDPPPHLPTTPPPPPLAATLKDQ